MNKGNEVEVISQEQGQVIDVAKAYAGGLKSSAVHYKGYGFLFGVALNQLKEITPHGKFETLAAQQFPDFTDRWLRELMTFSKALKLKTELSSVLKNGQLLLELPEEKKEELFDEIETRMGDKGIREVVFDWKKKQQRAKQKDEPAPSAADVAAQKMKAASDFVEELRSKMALALKNKNLALVPDAELDALEDDRIELGHYITALRKNRKSQKSKA